MDGAFLTAIAHQLVAMGKGILAADESTDTITKHFAKINVDSTEETRRAYRELLFTAPGIERFISGVILYDETIRQSSSAGVPFAIMLKNQGIIPGIKVDTGTVPMAQSPQEVVTEGLDGLAERLAEYKKMGADFAKWRAVFSISDELPSTQCIEENARRLARYAKMCQEADIVPIVEPEVLMDSLNAHHTIERCREVTTKTLREVFSALDAEQVLLPGMLLKPNMIVPARGRGHAAPSLVAEQTMACLRECVPAAVPGIVFLSGGQNEIEATENLQAITMIRGDAPWAMTFSYGRALQASALEAWGGKAENSARAQAVFIQRAHMNTLAARGSYTGE
jgi:fructose-bisphosphate aldolase class I